MSPQKNKTAAKSPATSAGSLTSAGAKWSGKKSSGKKSPVKKSPVKNSPGKKSAIKKSPGKKSAIKKASPYKSPAKMLPETHVFSPKNFTDVQVGPQIKGWIDTKLKEGNFSEKDADELTKYCQQSIWVATSTLRKENKKLKNKNEDLTAFKDGFTSRSIHVAYRDNLGQQIICHAWYSLATPMTVFGDKTGTIVNSWKNKGVFIALGQHFGIDDLQEKCQSEYEVHKHMLDYVYNPNAHGSVTGQEFTISAKRTHDETVAKLGLQDDTPRKRKRNLAQIMHPASTLYKQVMQVAEEKQNETFKLLPSEQPDGHDPNQFLPFTEQQVPTTSSFPPLSPSKPAQQGPTKAANGGTFSSPWSSVAAVSASHKPAPVAGVNGGQLSMAGAAGQLQHSSVSTGMSSATTMGQGSSTQLSTPPTKTNKSSASSKNKASNKKIPGSASSKNNSSNKKIPGSASSSKNAGSSSSKNKSQNQHVPGGASAKDQSSNNNAPGASSKKKSSKKKKTPQG
ncbi:MAG: hypothetical protein SGILL_006855 [Bacillariaceae sp.]